MRTKILGLLAVGLLVGPVAANAVVVTISTDSTITSQPSYTFGDYIFELVDPTNCCFNLINGPDYGGVEDYIVSNSENAMDFTLRRLDSAAFSLLGIRFAGAGSHVVGGVSLPAGLGDQIFQNFAFSGQAGVTNATSILFHPIGGYVQIAAFEVESVAAPEPGTLALLGLGLAGLGLSRRRRTE